MRTLLTFVIVLMTYGCTQTPTVAPIPAPCEVPAPAPAPKATTEIVASFIPVAGSPDDLNVFEKYIVPQTTVKAVMERYDWKQLEPQAGVYTFSQMDADIAKWQSKGKKTAVLISLISDTVNNTTPNTSTPAWVLAKVPSYSCPFIAPNSIPIIYDPKMMALTEPFILTVLKHLDTKAPWVLYFRTGMRGGENSPLCQVNFPQQETTGLDYIKSISTFVHLNHPVGTEFTSASSGGGWPDWPDQLGSIFAADNIGTGEETLSAVDASNYAAGKPCSSDWCGIFKAHPMLYKYLQPEVNLAPADLLTYYPFAETFGVNAIELRVHPDLSIAYNPNDPNYKQYGASYRTVLSK